MRHLEQVYLDPDLLDIYYVLYWAEQMLAIPTRHLLAILFSEADRKWSGTEVATRFFLESLILAQNERWQRA